MASLQQMRHVEGVRRFSRFYTRRIGVLADGLLGSDLSLVEARVVFELAHHESTTASELCRELSLDAGYVSRILKGLEERGLLERRPSEEDARRNVLRLTDRGQETFAGLNARSRHEVSLLLDHLSTKDQARLVEAMGTIETLLRNNRPRHVPYILRPHRPGDMGWVIARHGVLYAEQYGWDETFEALVAEVAARFLKTFDPARERCWIAEMDGANVGSVCLVSHSEETAKLRLLLVEPSARGLGIGRRLVAECIDFARLKDYRRIILWTNDVLHSARRIYESAGFRLVEETPHHSFGKNLVGQDWQLDLE